MIFCVMTWVMTWAMTRARKGIFSGKMRCVCWQMGTEGKMEKLERAMIAMVRTK